MSEEEKKYCYREDKIMYGSIEDRLKYKRGDIIDYGRNQERSQRFIERIKNKEEESPIKIEFKLLFQTHENMDIFITSKEFEKISGKLALSSNKYNAEFKINEFS